MPLWEAPGALWLGLTVPAILALWILRPRRPRARVPSLLLWPGSEAERQSARPWQRLRNHPLLWLQLAAALLLTVGAARPYLPASAAGQHLVVFLDASGSMRARDGEPDRFRAAARAVLGLARGLGPGQSISLIRLDQQPRVLVAEVKSAAQVEAVLAEQAPSFGPPDVAGALSLAAGLTRGPAEWVFVTDGGLALPEAARRPAGTGFRIISVGSGSANVAVTGLALRQSDGAIALQAGIRNAGSAPLSGRLQLLAEGELMGARDWQLEAGDETHLTWTHLPAAPTWYAVRLSGLAPESNLLAHDDSAWAAVPGADEPGVLLVTAGNTFLERVLSIHSGLRAFRAAPGDWPGLAAGGETYPLLILDRFLPDQLPPGSSTLLLGASGAGAAPAETFRPTAVYPAADHPLLRHVDWSDVRVGSARKLNLTPDWETVIDSDGGPLLAVRTEGGRRQAVLAFDLSQSDLALRPAFPVLMANLIDWLLPRPAAAPRTLPAGAAAAVEPAPLAQQVWAEAADGERTDLVPPWPPQPFRPPEPGLYRIIQSGEGIRQESVLVAEGYHPSESDVTPHRFELPPAGGGAAPASRGAFSFWPWLALAVLLVSLGEWWLDARGR